MEHDQKICPRCGEPAPGYGFCQPCRSEIDALTGLATRDAAQLGDHVLQEVARLEQALAAASDGMGDRVASAPAAAVQVDPDERVSIAPPPARDVARLEDVLTVLPQADDSAADASVAPPAVDDEQVASEAVDATLEIEGAGVETDEPAVDPEPAPITETGPSSTPQARASSPIYVAAHRLRAAFWFEQTSAFEQALALDADVDAEAPAPEEPQRAAEVLAPKVQPPARAAIDLEPPSLGDAQAGPPRGGSRNHWLLAICLLALLAVVVALTGRAPRRFTGQKTR